MARYTASEPLRRMAPNIHRLLRAGLLIVVFVILLATAYLAGLGNLRVMQQDAYDAGYEAALLEYGINAGDALHDEDEDVELLSVTGTVVGVENGVLTLAEEIATPDGPNAGSEVRITLADGGAVVGVEPKDPAVLERELAAYQRASRTNPAAPLPIPDIEQDIALTDLRPGDRVNALTIDPETDPVVASRIVRTAKAPEPPPPAPEAPTGSTPGELMPQ